MPNDAMARTWLRAAEENLDASHALRRDQRYRSAVSRAYYAAHHAVHAALLARGQKSPERGNWRHSELPGELRASLRQSSPSNPQWADYFHSSIQNAYSLRIQADYKPANDVGDEHARESHRVATCLVKYALEVVQ